jgi:hypothetical protein
VSDHLDPKLKCRYCGIAGGSHAHCANSLHETVSKLRNADSMSGLEELVRYFLEVIRERDELRVILDRVARGDSP